MSEDDHTELVRVEHGALALTSFADNRIPSEMASVSLVLARDSAAAPVDLDALVQEGKRFQGGHGITPESMRAFSLFYQAALAGHSEAQYLVSECYHLIRGVKRDEAQALAWLRKSAQSGFVKAFIRLALFYQRSVPKNDEEAIKWYQKAAEAGSNTACILIAGIYKDRNDVAGELRWSKKAALRGAQTRANNLPGTWDYQPDSGDVRKFYEGYNLEYNWIDVLHDDAWVD
jgi:TPR repeat protein